MGVPTAIRNPGDSKECLGVAWRDAQTRGCRADGRRWRGVLGRGGVNFPVLIHGLRTQAKRGKLTIAGKERVAMVWAGDVAAQRPVDVRIDRMEFV